MGENKLFPEDQARVDHYLKEGYNDVERKPFRPMRLLGFLALIVTAFSLLSVGIARYYGIH